MLVCHVGLGGFCFVLLSFVPTSFVGMEVLVLLALRVCACVRVRACIHPSSCELNILLPVVAT